MTANCLELIGPKNLVSNVYKIPKPGFNEAILKIEACGLCGTDHEQYSGLLPSSAPTIPGHEIIGVIEEIGEGGKERFNVNIGDRVAVEVFQSCRECRSCLAGHVNNCEVHGIFDMYGFISSSKPPSLWGGYSTHLFLSADALIHKVPPGLDPVVATIFNPLGAGIRWGVSVPETKAGDVVAILGPGIRGLCALAAVKDVGASFVMLTGYGEDDDERLKVGKSFGADVTVNVAEKEPDRVMKSEIGTLADVVINVTANAPDAIGQAISLVRQGGTIVLAGTTGVADVKNLWPDNIIYKEITIKGALGVDSNSYAKSLELLEGKKYPFEHLPRKIVGLQGASSLLEEMSGSKTRPIHGVITP